MLAWAIALVAPSSTQAASIAVNWSASDAALELANGTPLPIGSLVQIGFMTGLSNNIANFTPWASGAIGDGFGVPGVFGESTTADEATASHKQIYMVAWDTPDASGNYGIFTGLGDPNWVFPAFSDIPNSTSLELGDASVVIIAGASPGVPDDVFGDGSVIIPGFEITSPLLLASFTASPTNGAAPLNVTFTDTSTGTVTNHSWTFGDGGTSTSSSPSHTYTNAGSFNVALTVSGPAGSSTTNRVNLITVTNGATTAVSIVRPGTGMLYPSTFTNQTITIVATASDSDGISKIEFFRDGTNKLGETTSNPGTNLWNGPRTLGGHTLRAVAHNTLGASNTSATVTITIGAKNSPLGDWEVTIGGADKGVEFVTFEDDFSASGFGIRLKQYGENDVSGTWGFDAKGRLTGLPRSFIEQLGSATNWTGTLAGSAKSLKSLSASVTTANVGVFSWKGVPATEFPDLSGTWTGVVTIVKTPTSVSYAIRTNANNSAVFDMTTTINTNTVIGQLIATSRDVVYGYVAVGGTNITMSGKFNEKKLSLTFKGAVTDTPAEKISIQLFQ
jgi:PKD repeat protein